MQIQTEARKQENKTQNLNAYCLTRVVLTVRVQADRWTSATVGRVNLRSI